MKEKLKIVFMGTSDLAGIILESLIESPHELLAVVTQPDSEDKRKKTKITSPVKETALQNKIKVLQPEKLDDAFASEVKDLNPDIIIVAAYGKILPKEILEIPKFKSLNVHASLLPKLRGPSPIQNSLLQGDKQTGITIMVMDKGIDTGNILSQKEIEIKDNDDYITLTSKLAIAGAKLLLDTLEKWVDQKIEPMIQDNDGATLCQLIERSDGRIFWDKSAEEIYNAFRAFRVWPGIFTFWNIREALKKISLTSISIDKNTDPIEQPLGKVFQREDKKICVQTSAGVIIIDKLQMEGKKETDIASFINGYPEFIGSVLK